MFITVIFFTLILFGALCYKNLNYELIPKFEFGALSISTSYIGASSNEVQTSVTKPIEDALESIEGVDEITSTSLEGLSFVGVSLKPGVDVKTAQLDAERKISQIKATLPSNAYDPVVNRFSTDDAPIMQFSITSSLNGTQFYDFIDQQLRPQLSNVEGVAQVTVTGGNKRQLNVSIDNDKMSAFNVSPAELNQAVMMAGAAFPAGTVNNKQSRFSIDLNAKVKTTEELRNVVIRQNADGSRILLRDVAYISDGQTESTRLNRINGNAAIGIQISKQTDANTVNVSALVKAKLEKFKKDKVAKDFNYHIASDSSVYTLDCANAAMDDLMMAILIVSVVMLFFLHSFRSASFVLVAIPAAMIPTFIAMYAFGFTLNLMTLISLSLVIGVLVDDSIVVLENIYRHLEMGKDKRTAAIEGRREISITAVAITLVDVVVFIPLALSGGFLGGLLKQYSLVIVFSTLMSLMVAFTLTPLMASRWGKLTILKKTNWWSKLNTWFESIIDDVKTLYAKALLWALCHKRYIFIGATVLFFGAVSLLPTGFVGGEFFPNSDQGELSIQLDLPSQTPLKQTNQVVAQIESIIMKHPEVKNVFSNVGMQTMTGGANGDNSNLAEISVILKDTKNRSITTTQFNEIIRKEIQNIAGIKPTIRLTGMTGNNMFDLSLAVKGVDMDSVLKVAEIVKKIMVSTPGSDFVQYSTKDPKQQVSINMDRNKMARLGVTVADLGNAVQYAFRGNDNTKFYDKGQDYNINLMLDEADRTGINNIRNLNVINSRGVSVPLSELATIEMKAEPAMLERTDRLNSITINAAASGRPSGTIMDEVQAKMAKITLPKGVSYSWEGMSKDQGDAFGNLGTAILIAIILMYLVMVALYESVVYPFVVLFSLPMALIGAIMALALTLNSMNIFSILGILMLFGLVAKNGILLVDFANHEQAKGVSLKDALLSAGKERIRPIMMTTVAMVCGMMPMALSIGAGSESKRSMAWVIIGGMLTSMIFTLVLVPSVYMVIEKLKIKVNGWFAKKGKVPVAILVDNN
jgi:HAE1 family hydrophobic/amphiphilic exporter-1